MQPSACLNTKCPLVDNIVIRFIYKIRVTGFVFRGYTPVSKLTYDLWGEHKSGDIWERIHEEEVSDGFYRSTTSQMASRNSSSCFVSITFLRIQDLLDFTMWLIYHLNTNVFRGVNSALG